MTRKKLHSIPIAVFFLGLLFFSTQKTQALEPSDPDLIPEARAVLNYLDSIYGNNILTGTRESKEAGIFQEQTGRYPALAHNEMWGFVAPHWEHDYFLNNVSKTMDQFIRDWHNGSIPVARMHWGHPLIDTTNTTKKQSEVPVDLVEAMTPGTDLNALIMEDLNNMADSLQRVVDADVPILFRILHEITGGWFWWNDAENPENTAEFWRFVWRFFVEERGFHNLIWVWSAGENGLNSSTAVADRAAYYPGDEYVDIGGIDVYSSDSDTPIYGSPGFYNIMTQVAPGKMLCLCEAKALPNADTLTAYGPKWLYAMSWYNNSYENANLAANSDLYITRDELPDLNPANNPVDIYISSPPQDYNTGSTAITVAPTVIDKEGDLEKVVFYANEDSIGVATSAPWSFDWTAIPPGVYNVEAKTIDAAGNELSSSSMRYVLGRANVALNKTVTSSWDEDTTGISTVVDGNSYVGWGVNEEITDSSDTSHDTLLVTVDLGDIMNLSGALIRWKGSNTEDPGYKVLLSTDGENWNMIDSVGKPEKDDWTEHVFDTIPAQFLRMEILTQHNTYKDKLLRMSGIWEIQIFDDGSAPVSITETLAQPQFSALKQIRVLGEGFALEVPADTDLQIYDINGKVVQRVQGSFSARLENLDLPAGVYFTREIPLR